MNTSATSDKTWVACNSCGSVNRVPLERMAQHPKCGSCKIELPVHGLIIDQNAKSLPNLVQASDKPVVVDFWAPWCGPCLSFAPRFEAVSNQYGKEYVFAKVDTEANPTAGGMYGVRGIPTLIMFHYGQEVQRISGAMPEAQFVRWIKEANLSQPS